VLGGGDERLAFFYGQIFAFSGWIKQYTRHLFHFLSKKRPLGGFVGNILADLVFR